MGNLITERWAKLTGVGFVAVFIVAGIVLADLPKADDKANTIANFYDGHRTRALVGLVLLVMAFMMFLWFVGAVADVLREAGEGRLAATTIVMAATFGGVEAFGGAAVGALAYNVAGSGDARLIETINTFIWTQDVIHTVPIGLVMAAASIGLRRAQVLPNWYGWFGLATAAITVSHVTNWARHGFWSPSGGWFMLAMLCVVAWVLVTSVLLFRQAPVAATQAAVASTG